MKAAEVRRILRRAVEAEGSLTAWATKNGVSKQYVSDVLNEKSEPGDSVLEPLGLRRKPVEYERIAAA